MNRLLCGVAIATTLSTTPLTAAGKGSSVSAIILNTPNAIGASAAVNWEPSLGDTVSFTVRYQSSLDRYQVSVQVLCYQDGAIVFATAGLHDRSLLLGGTSSQWLERGGAATCHADLYYWSTNNQKFNQLAWTEFSAQGR